MLQKMGLDPGEVPYQTALAIEQREVSRWLPLALSSLYSLLAASSGMKHPPKLPKILRSWGLTLDADALDKAFDEAGDESTDRALAMFFDPVKDTGKHND